MDNKEFEKSPDAMQYRWNILTGEIDVVPSTHHEGPPLEEQADLMLWGDQQDALSAWKAGQ
jgi:hypothetical protein